MIVDNDYFNDARVPNEARILCQKYNVFILCFKFMDAPSSQPPTINYQLSTINYPITIIQIPITKKLKNILFGIQNTFPLYDHFLAYHALKMIKKHKIEAIHVHDLFLSYTGWLVKKKANIPLIIDLHENYPEAVIDYQWTNHWLKKIIARPQKWTKKEPRLLSLADKIVVTNEVYKDILLSKYSFLNAENVFIYENVPDLKLYESFLIEKDILNLHSKDTCIIFHFGVISEKRGVSTILEAVKSLRIKYPNIHLLLIGPVVKAELPIFEPLLKEEYITYYPWKDISTLPSYVTASHICISALQKTKHHESCFANKIFQYLLYAKPLIVSDVRPHKEFVEKYNCGVVYKAGDPDDLSQKIENLLNDPIKAKELGENGKYIVERKYNTEYFGKNLLSLYEMVTLDSL